MAGENRKGSAVKQECMDAKDLASY
jgi:hypothetical protein